MHACGKLHRTYLPWGQLNFLPEKTSKRCLKAFFHRGTRAAAELSADWFPGFRNQVHFLDFLPNLSPASARETVFLDVPLALTPCGYTGPKFGSEQTLFGAHTWHWFPRKQGRGGTSVTGPMFCFCWCFPSEPGEREVLKTAIELQWHWWFWHWPEHTWGSLPSLLGLVVRLGWDAGMLPGVQELWKSRWAAQCAWERVSSIGLRHAPGLSEHSFAT